MLAGKASTTNNSANINGKLLTTAAMVENLAEKVEKCGSLSIVCVQLGPRKLAVIRSREVATKQVLF